MIKHLSWAALAAFAPALHAQIQIEAGSFDDPNIASLTGQFDSFNVFFDNPTGTFIVTLNDASFDLELADGTVIGFTGAEMGVTWSGFFVDPASGDLLFFDFTIGGTINGAGDLLPGSYDFLVNLGDALNVLDPLGPTSAPLVSAEVTTASGAAVSSGSGFVFVPAPGAAGILGAAGLLATRRRRE